MNGVRGLLLTLLGVASALLLGSRLCAQAPAPGQGGYVNGAFRDYDAFLANYLQNGSGNPGLTGLPPSTPRFSALKSVSIPPSSSQSLSSRLSTLSPGTARLTVAAGQPATWVYRREAGYYYSVASTGNGAVYYWVYWASEKRCFYCYDSAREQYVGLYDYAVRLYRPYDAKDKRWGEGTSSPVPPPAEPPDPARASQVSPKPGVPEFPKPPLFRIETPARKE